MTKTYRKAVHQHATFLFCVTGIIALAVAACSLNNLDRKSCSSNDQCAAFGAGSTCGSEGYCIAGSGADSGGVEVDAGIDSGDDAQGGCKSTAECQATVGFGSVCDKGECVDIVPHPRCTKTFPATLLTELDKHRHFVVFGSLMDRSSSVHQGRENGMESAGVVVNDARGFDDSRFGIVFCDIYGGSDNPYDDLARPDAAVAAASWLAEDLQVPAIIGVAGSGDTQRVYTEVIQQADPPVVLISPSASSPGLTDLDTNEAADDAPGFLWRTASSAGDQGPVLANDMAKRQVFPMIKNVAIIREKGSFGEGVAAPFIEAWTAKGGTNKQFIFDDGNASQREERIVEAGNELGNFQAVLFIAQTADSKAFLSLATDSSAYPDDIPLYFPQTGANPSLFAAASSSRLFASVRATRQSVDTSTFPYQTFETQFKNRFDADPGDFTFSAHSYDAMWLLSLASVWSVTQEGVLSGLGVAKGLRRMVGGTVEVPFTASGWATGVVQMRQGNRVDAIGASGQLDFDLKTEEKPGGVELLEGSPDGTFKVIGSF